MKIEIIGNGTVGRALAKNMKLTAQGKSEEPIIADVVIICVPTPSINGKQDITEVKHVIKRIKSAKLVILRSTVLPGTTEKLQKQFNLPMIFVPEFGFEKTMVKDLGNPDFYIFGSQLNKKNSQSKLARQVLPKAKKYFYVKTKVAEYAKYFVNIWGCSQVVLANTFFDWCKDPKVYQESIEVAQNFKNLPHWGWKISEDGYRGYGGKCLPKDIQAAVGQYPSEIWQAFEKYNQRLQRGEKKKTV